MFTAKGGAVFKLPGGPYQVRVDYFADATPEKPILSQQYVVVDSRALKVHVVAQLQDLKRAADDAVTNMNIVGKKLGSI